MSHPENPEVQPKATRRRFSAAYKRQSVMEAEQCAHGELGTLLRREGLSYSQVAAWRKAGSGDRLTGPGQIVVENEEVEQALMTRLRLGESQCLARKAGQRLT
jgi:transposase-like protein